MVGLAIALAAVALPGIFTGSTPVDSAPSQRGSLSPDSAYEYTYRLTRESAASGKVSLTQHWTAVIDAEGRVVRAVVHEFDESGFLTQEGLVDAAAGVTTNRNYLEGSETQVAYREQYLLGALDGFAGGTADSSAQIGAFSGASFSRVVSVVTEAGDESASGTRWHRIVVADNPLGLVLSEMDEIAWVDGTTSTLRDLELASFAEVALEAAQSSLEFSGRAVGGVSDTRVALSVLPVAAYRIPDVLAAYHFMGQAEDQNWQRVRSPRLGRYVRS
jgi:hypothetical protein